MERGTRGFFLGVVVALLTASPTNAAVDLEFDYRYDTTGFFAAGSEARESLLAAGDFYESNLNDTLTAITSYGGNHFNAVIQRPDTDAEVTINDFDVQDSKVYVFVGARDLGGSTLGLGGPCRWSVSYYSSSWYDNVRTRGQGSVDDVIGDTAIDYAPWGGSIALDIDSAWHDDPTRNPSGSNNDLYTVLVHELGHVLGIGISDSWYNLINAGNQFTGVASVAEYGGNVPLTTDGAHWADGTTSTVYVDGPSRATAMGPYITTGTRKMFTALDVAGMDDVGWTINPVRVWNKSAGGAFATGGNWSTGVPTARDTAKFALPATYTVQFAANQSSQQVEVDGGNVTFALGGKTYTVDDLYVSGSGSALRVGGGTVQLIRQGFVATDAALTVASGGTLQLDGGLQGSVTIESGGVLTGSGYVDRNVVNGGEVRPGLGPGVLTIGNNYTQQSTGTLSVELGGLAQETQYDLLDVGGTATLGGELEIAILGGFAPSLLDSFLVMSCYSRTGVFSTVTGDELPSGLVLAPDYGARSLTLVATVPGDANLDGAVNDTDASIVGAHWRSSGLWTDGDFNGDGLVNDRDAAVMAAHWQQGSESQGPFVPEPATPVLLLGAVVAAWSLLRKRGHG
ncbi:MAG: matrixin family metalloprotease [Planctomycetia bacterium]|nr:matrixin family metalloprotease [Planctomycetia bacterium]